jgi:hypothetical protein
VTSWLASGTFAYLVTMIATDLPAMRRTPLSKAANRAARSWITARSASRRASFRVVHPKSSRSHGGSSSDIREISGAKPAPRNFGYFTISPLIFLEAL